MRPLHPQVVEQPHQVLNELHPVGRGLPRFVAAPVAAQVRGDDRISRREGVEDARSDPVDPGRDGESVHQQDRGPRATDDVVDADAFSPGQFPLARRLGGARSGVGDTEHEQEGGEVQAHRAVPHSAMDVTGRAGGTRGASPTSRDRAAAAGRPRPPAPSGAPRTSRPAPGRDPSRQPGPPRWAGRAHPVSRPGPPGGSRRA